MGISFGKSKAQLQALSREALLAETERIIRDADDIDQRRQIQVQNQIAAINRLLVDGSFNGEMEKLHEELVDRDRKLGMVRAITADVLHYGGGESVFVSGLERIMEIFDPPKEVSDAAADD